MVSRLLTACYTLFTQHAVSFLVVAFVVLAGLSAGIVTGDAIDTVQPLGMPLSLVTGVLGFAVLCLSGVTPLLTPVIIAAAGFYAYSVGVRIPMMRPGEWGHLPGTLLGGTGAVLSLCAVCAACAVALSIAVQWTRGLRIPLRERAARLTGHYALTALFWLLYATGALMAGFIY